MWLPETAVDLATLAALADAGIEATILAPWQADVENLDTPRGRTGSTSAAAATSRSCSTTATCRARSRSSRPRPPTRTGSRASGSAAPGAPWAPARGGDVHHGDDVDPLVVIASDGELYGHHQSFRDLFLERLVAPEDPATRTAASTSSTSPPPSPSPTADPHPEIRIRERTSWSCHHGVLRWFAECPDVPDGRWKAPLRSALDRLAGGIDAVTRVARRAGCRGLDDVWAARDAYVDVVIGAATAEAFAAGRLAGARRSADAAALLDLLEAQRWRLAMFASDGWYWDDPSRPETRQVLRSAARAVRIVDRLAGTALESRLVADLATLRSPALDVDGAAIYRHALSEVGQPPPGRPGMRRSAATMAS